MHRPRGAFSPRQWRTARTDQLARQQLAARHPESFGIMVNYLYDRDTIEDNHKAFVRGTIVRSQQVDAILKGVAVDEVDTRPNSAKRR
jgi:hypothetical protein